MANQPLVTIVIIAYNEERYLGEAIQSSLDQTYKNIEILVVDDGSKDNTKEVGLSFGDQIKYIWQENSGGCSGPRNNGLNHASGDLIVFLDGDDILSPTKVESHLKHFESYPDIVMSVLNYCNFNEDGNQPDHFSTCSRLLSIKDSQITHTGKPIFNIRRKYKSVG